jgi:hypothetical protein
VPEPVPELVAVVCPLEALLQPVGDSATQTVADMVKILRDTDYDIDGLKEVIGEGSPWAELTALGFTTGYIRRIHRELKLRSGTQ